MKNNPNNSRIKSADGRFFITEIPKRDGNIRVIHEAATPEIAKEALELTEYLTNWLRTKYFLREHTRVMQGGLPGAVLADNVTPHRLNKHFFLGDISKAFPSLTIETLVRVIDELEIPNMFDEAWRTTLLRLANDPAYGEGLVTGMSPVPALFNIGLIPFDDQLKQWCYPEGYGATRWIDDITVSSPEEGLGKKSRNQINRFLGHLGLSLNPDKNQYLSLDRGPVTITGVTLHPDGHFQISYEAAKVLEQIMDDTSRMLDAWESSPQNPVTRPKNPNQGVLFDGDDVFDLSQVRTSAKQGRLSHETMIEQIDRLNGYHGMMQPRHDDSRTPDSSDTTVLSPLEYRLECKYRETLSRARGLGLLRVLKQRGKVGIQILEEQIYEADVFAPSTLQADLNERSRHRGRHRRIGEQHSKPEPYYE